MGKKQLPGLFLVLVIVLISWMGKPVLSMAGTLNPSATPAPTMKTLTEVEPRTSIPGSDTPVSVFTISQSGSYYLTGDRICSGVGIQVDADDVTIDLMGFTLSGPGSEMDNGVNMSERKNVEVRNGTIRNFYNGIYESSSAGKGLRVIGVRSIANILHGVYLNSTENLIKNCRVSENGISAGSDIYGIFTSNGAEVSGNNVSDNGNSAAAKVYGIYAAGGARVTGNTVYDNGDGGNSIVYGISTGNSVVVLDNTVYQNGFGANNAVYGIKAGGGNTVSKNTVRFNGRNSPEVVWGIFADDGSTVVNNTSANNGYNGSGTVVYGIAVNEGSSVIGNTSHYNGRYSSGVVYGIYLYGNSLVDQNTAYDNENENSLGTNMSCAASCTFGTNHAP